MVKMRNLSALVLVVLAIIVFSEASSVKPVVLWHGMGDTCCFSFSMGRVKQFIENVTGAYVHSIRVGDSIVADEFNGFFMNINDQVDFVCNLLKADPKLSGGFNAVGFSQGGLFMRAYIERCNDPPVFNFITLGSPHQGVYGLPNCPGSNRTLCDWLRIALDYGVYVSFIQNHVVQAEFWQRHRPREIPHCQDPLYLDQYLKYNIFLPDINNHLQNKTARYKTNLLSLNNFVLGKFTEDEMIQPAESEWFEFYYPGQSVKVQPLRESQLYLDVRSANPIHSQIQDWLGLQTLDKSGRLKFISIPGPHMHFTLEWFRANVVVPYLLAR